MEEESTKVRQINEVCALKAIYGDDLIKLNSSSSWSPTEIKLRVYPAQASRGDKRDNCSAVLHIKCSENYPNEVPEFKLEEVKGLQHKLRNQLANELQELAKRKCGEVVIFDFAQHVQMFLHDHNQPGFESFYDEMLSRRTTSQQAELQDRLSKNAQEREALLTQIKEQRDILKAKVRKASHRDDGSNTEIKSMGMYMPTDEQCHCSTISNEIAYRGQRIRCYQCLGPSSVVGCCRRNGVLLPQGITNGDGDSQNKEQNTYENFFIRTWYRCLNAVDDNVASTTVNQVRAELRKLSRICHPVLPAPSLIQADLKYVQSIRRHIPGVSVKYFIDSAISSVNLTKIVARGVLEALSILHSDDLCHGSLRPSCIIIEDKCAIVGEVADAVLINLYHLQKGINKRPVSQEKDLSALCRILRKLLPQNLPPDAIDFLTRFSGADRWSAKQLCEHPWLTIEIETAISHYNEDEDLSESSDSETEELENMISSQPARSRLREDFDIIKWLGRGAFGDVYKARNKLDGALYAIKCVKLDLKRPQFCRKITKEVKFVARLCHDNVVRYYNAWVEEQNEPENKSQKRSISEENDSLRLPQHDSEDDWFAFEGSDENDSGNENLEVEIESADDVSLSVDEPQRACLYIQMELCSKATLRRAIDKQSLNENRVRAWRLFTEIVNGLAHVHARGMIHRDLKPGNIFLDVNDRVKIGDFGLATTRVAPAIETIPDDMISESKDSTATSLTGNVGTFLYAAPELNRSTRVAYNQKVDIYSLGIILFEMFHPAFGTGSERIKVLANLRNETIIVPKHFQKPELHNVLDLVRWCVNHNADSRPTCSELLSNECFRGQEPKVEAVHERSAPIIASALAGRVLSAADRAIFDTAAGKRAFRRHTSTLELVKDVCVNTFRLFGARELSAPLLLPPALPGTNEEDGCVRLVMSSGAPARLPCELHSGLSRLPALAGGGHLRRYSLDRVYRQRSGGLHPQERLQAAFDILTLDAAFPWADAEVLAATCKVLQSLGLHNGSYLRIGHTDLSASALAAAKLPPEVCSSWVWSHRHQAVSVASQPLQEENKQLLRSLLTCEVSLEGLQNSGTGGALRSLARRRDDSGHRAREALHQIQLFIEYAQSLGMDMGIRVGINIPHTIDQSGVIWELVQSAREARGAVLACGGRYDGLMRREADGAPHINHSLLHAVGASLDIEKISELTGTIADNATVAIMISADQNVKSDSMTRSANLARILREANIPVQILEGDLQSSGDQTKNIQCTWESGRWIVSRDFDMRQCREDDVVNTLSGMLRQKCHSVTVNPSPQHKRSMTVLPVAVSVSLVGVDHNAGLRRRCEEAASANAKRALQALGVNPKAVHVLAIDASAQLVRSLVAELDPVPPFNADKAIHRLCDAYPRQRNILTAVEEALSMKMSQPTVIAFYSIKDNICKFLL